MTDISKHTLDKIKKDNVRPIPKFYFLFRGSVLWTLFGFSILFGSIASSIAIFLMKHAEWDVYQYISHSLIKFILLIFPYGWLLFLIGFSIFAYIFFHRTEQGYRYKTLWIVCLSIACSILGGTMLYGTELPERLEKVFQEHVPFYRGLEYHKRRVWMFPSRGLLAGKITRIRSKETIQIKDLNGDIWDIGITHAIWRGGMRPYENLKIKLIGRQDGKNQFIAKEIRPWKGKRQRGRRRGS